MENFTEKHENVGNFYSTQLLPRFWELTNENQIHIGYWEGVQIGGDASVGAKKLTDLMLGKVEIRAGEKFIDIGCGYGVPGVLLAKMKNCEIDGITASDYQLDLAKKLVEKENLQGKVRFQLADALALPYANESFDGGWFFESIFHMGHTEALKEAHRVLKSGATLAISDFPKLSGMTTEDRQYLKEISLFTTIVSMDEYPKLLESCGFEFIDILDIGKNVVAPSWACYHVALENNKQIFLDMAGEDGYKFLKKTIVEFENVIVRALGYCVVRARKK